MSRSGAVGGVSDGEIAGAVSDGDLHCLELRSPSETPPTVSNRRKKPED